MDLYFVLYENKVIWLHVYEHRCQVQWIQEKVVYTIN